LAGLSLKGSGPSNVSRFGVVKYSQLLAMSIKGSKKVLNKKGAECQRQTPWEELEKGAMILFQSLSITSPLEKWAGKKKEETAKGK